MFADRTGTSRTEMEVNRVTGRFRLEINANAPGKAPFHFLSVGQCTGVDPPGSSASPQPTPDSNPSRPAPSAAGTASMGTPVNDAKPEVATANDEAQQQRELARKERESAEAERVRAAKLARDRAEAERSRKEEEARQIAEQAEAERKRKEAEELASREMAKAEARRLADQQRRSDEAMLRETFNAQATSCPGGGSGILYLRSSKPPRLGCNVTFEARCAGTAASSVINFGQRNYIGSSCLGIGDAIRIGQMPCPAEQVQIQMTSATCS